ncbi:MarR family winged helix-turn-helix transcriptional regulator [Burkholderia ubonensis]|uniref:MarR family winged helix-turn-helix transcriptional regulator n=1 Tax=Burkholderia ubonensis TaxID=101571 RepID=UPI00084187CD|nr:MarR family transcriptional regulator [Burkholderia ubonensis]
MDNAASLNHHDAGTRQAGDGLGYLLKRTQTVMCRAISRRTEAELGVTDTQARILFLLANHSARTAADLARQCEVDASSITRMIDRMERRGLLERMRCDEDRRIVRLRITPLGQAVAARIPAIVSDVSDALLSTLDTDEIHSLRCLLDRIVENGTHHA